MNEPWTDGPRELLQHAATHLGMGADFDRRIAMISIDNAVELAIKTYIGLPKRSRGTDGPTRKELEAANESFPELLDLLNRYYDDKLTGVDLGDVEWYHRLRNLLYHSGNGITVNRARVEAYFQIALALFENLFGFVPSIDGKTAIRTKTGEFLQLWTNFDQSLRMKLPPKNGLAYYWKKEFLEGVSTEAASLWVALTEFRNKLVHSVATDDPEDLDRSIRDVSRLIGILEQHT